MTIQRRTLIEPADIIGIEFECRHCGSRYLVPLQRFDRRVGRCPNCQEKWLKDGHEQEHPSQEQPSGDQAISLLVECLRECLQKIQARDMGAVVRLQIGESVQ